MECTGPARRACCAVLEHSLHRYSAMHATAKRVRQVGRDLCASASVRIMGYVMYKTGRRRVGRHETPSAHSSHSPCTRTAGTHP
jgi:hypothetical protein